PGPPRLPLRTRAGSSDGRAACAPREVRVTRWTRSAALAAALLLVLFLVPGLVLAQTAPEELASQTLGRAYWHVFIGYAAAWVLVGGWVISMARRMARLEK